MSNVESGSTNPPVMFECPTVEEYGQTHERLVSEGYRFSGNVDAVDIDSRTALLLRDKETSEVVLTSAYSQSGQHLSEMFGVYYR